MKAKLTKIHDQFYLYNHEDDFIAATENNPYQRLSMKNCQAIERGYDLDELARQEAEKIHIKSSHEDWDVWECLVREEAHSIKIGMVKMLELVGDKKFSEEDVRRVIDKGIEIGSSNCRWDLERYDAIQSLQQTEWDVEIEMEDTFESNQGLGHNEFIKCKVLRIEGDNVYGEYIEGTKTNLDIPFSLSGLNEIEGNSVGKPKLDADGCLILKRI